MSARLLLFVTLFLLSLLAYVSPAIGISISCSSGGGGESVSSSETFDIDDSTSLQESISLGFGSLSKSRQASGSGNNSIDESIAGTDYSLQNNVQSSGSFGLSSSAAATSQSGVLSQDVAGTGSMSISLSSAEGSREASQEASVAYGALDSVQVIAAGQGVAASQSTGMAGLEGSFLSGAVGDENVMGAAGTFTGAGIMTANLASTASAENGRASAGGAAALDGLTFLDESSFQAVSSQSLGMGLAAARDIGDGSLGTLDMSVLNLEKPDMQSAALTSQSAGQTAGGSPSSYLLTGYRWNQNNPRIQLYLNSNNAPSGVTATNSQAAIAAAANTWDDAVAQNIFADGTTVIVDNTKVVDNPFSTTPVSDGYNVNGWAPLGGNYLGLTRWWSNGQSQGGYNSITEADNWYASEKAWTTDLSKATGNTFDLQSVAVHELGHTIGLGDLYTLPNSDPRKSDFAQVMNSYDGAQRVLGNGDLTGAQILYGSPIETWESGDVNGDGLADLIRLSGDYAESWISNGDGTYQIKYFSPGSGYIAGLGLWETGDLNGDGKMDLSHISGANVDSWISNGDGTYQIKYFSPWSGYGTGLGRWETGDLNGDGKMDLSHIGGGDWVNSWISNGDGTYQIKYFSPWSGYGTGLGRWETGDLNGDGKVDLSHIGGGDWVNSWISKGDGTYQIKYFSPWSGYGTGLGQWKDDDLNGDGKADLSHIGGGDWVNSWISKGDGTYQIKYFSPWSGYGTGLGQWKDDDLNGDGKVDLSHIGGGDWVNSWISKGDGTYQIKYFSPWAGYATGLGQWKVGDVNGDGKIDLSHISGTNVDSWISNGDGIYSIKAFTP